MRAWRQKNLAYARALDRESKARHRAKVLEAKRDYRKRNADKIRAYNAVYTAANAEKARLWRKRWQMENPAVYREARAMRRAREVNACPSWADREAIRRVYEERNRVSAETGVTHHVDHIVPLAGLKVCGLHVSWNLRVIPGQVNARKGRKLVEA
jgi:hypothetical protein